MGFKLYSVRFDLRGIQNDLVKQSVKQVALFDNVEISNIFHVDGLVLLVTSSDLIVWNPYMEQQRWIGPTKFREFDNYAFGYDQNHNYKILMVTYGYIWEERKLLKGSVHSWILRAEYDIYDFNSDTWRILDVTPDQIIDPHQRGVTLKGNSTYFLATEKKEKEHCLLSFDFTKESFGRGLNLPSNSYEKFDTVTLSCIHEERLAILRQKSRLYDFLDIWVTNKIEPNAVSWNKIFTVDVGKQIGFQFKRASFFIDEEKKLAVIFATTKNSPCDPTAYIIGEDGYFKSVSLGGSMDEFSYISPQVSSFYLPSLLQIKQKRKRKRN